MLYMLSQEVAWLLGEKYHGEKSAAFFADVIRLEAGEPLAFIIGSIPFLNTTISLDSRPLIPRPETEFWVERAIKDMQLKCSRFHPQLDSFAPASPQPNPPAASRSFSELGVGCEHDSSYVQGQESQFFQILDLCAGSGAIGVAVAKDCPTAQVDFVELDSRHLPTIAKNCRQNNIAPERVDIYAGNLFTPANGAGLPKYDFILSNPPYIDQSLGRTEASVVAHEPALALYGGAAGMEVIAKIILEAPQYLQLHGQLWLEHEPEQTAAIHALGAKNFLVSTHKDQYNVERFSKLMLQ
jgi:release factor glutamine methyltransferase